MEEDPYDLRVRGLIVRLHKETIVLHARCDALTSVVAHLGERLGLSDAETRALLKQVYDQAHQERLEQVENKYPGLAAELSSLDDSPL